MMQHEVDKEIHNLQTNMSALKRHFDKQIADLHLSVDQLKEDVIKLKEKDGQANSQDREGSKERPKGHKKAS